MKHRFLCLIIILASVAAAAQDYKGSTVKNPEQKLNDEYCSGLFNSTEGTILDLTSETTVASYLNILDWLQGRVAGVQVYKNWSGISIPVIRGGVPGLFIDEIQVSPAQLNNISINDIAIVKIIKSPFYGGFNSAHGAIAIYTKGEEEAEDQ
jgi:hypothetical protein